MWRWLELPVQNQHLMINRDAVARIKKHTDLPVAVGFGIKTLLMLRKLENPQMQCCCSSLVSKIGGGDVVGALEFVKDLSGGLKV